MIADFYESFEEERDNKLDIPQEILDVLNQELPHNFVYYKDQETGKYIAGPSVESLFQEMILTVDIEGEALEKLKNIPQDKWPEYLYRTQMAIPVKNLRIGDSDKQVPIEKTIGNPFDNAKVSDVMMYPQPFPEPFVLRLESPEGDEIEIHIQQQVYDSVTEIKFSNIDFPALQMDITLKSSLLEDVKDDDTMSKLTYSVTPTKADTVTEALKALHIFVGLLDGKTKINGKVMKATDASFTVNREQMESALLFWNTAKAIEEKLGVSFKPSAEFSYEDAQFFSELDVCLLKEKSIYWKHPFEHFHVGGVHVASEISFEDIIGKEEIRYRFLEGPISATLLGTEFELYSNTEMVDLIITNIEWDNDKKISGELYVADAPGKTWRLIRRYITAEDAEKQMIAPENEGSER